MAESDTQRNTKVLQVTRDTLLPLGVVLAIILFTWAAASQWGTTSARVDENTLRLAIVTADIETNAKGISLLREDMREITTRLSQLPIILDRIESSIKKSQEKEQ